MKVNGLCKIDSVEIAEISVRSRGTLPGTGIQAVYVLKNEKTGERFGSGTTNIWSDETVDKLNEAIKAMEADIASLVFQDATTDSVNSEERPLSDGVPGL